MSDARYALVPANALAGVLQTENILLGMSTDEIAALSNQVVIHEEQVGAMAEVAGFATMFGFISEDEYEYIARTVGNGTNEANGGWTEGTTLSEKVTILSCLTNLHNALCQYGLL